MMAPQRMNTRAAIALPAATALCAILLSGVLAPPIARAAALPVPPAYQERIGALNAEYEQTVKALREVQARIRAAESARADAAARRQDTSTLFEILAALEKLRADMKKLDAEVADLFEAPPMLKLVRITGPKSGSAPRANAGCGTVEVEHAPNSAGFVRRDKDCQGQVESSAAVAVTYAPLSIVPGEPFHFEVEARQAVSPGPNRPPCPANRFDRMGAGLELEFLRADMQGRVNPSCEPASVKLSFRLKPKAVHLAPGGPLNSDYWVFSYVMELSGNGIAVVGSPPREKRFDPTEKEIASFKLPIRKSAIGLKERKRYALDVSARLDVAGMLQWGQHGELVLHYQAVDQAMGFLPAYAFPDDTSTMLVAVPDLKGRTLQEAKQRLGRIRLGFNYRSVLGNPPNAGLSGKIGGQEPGPGVRVKANSKVQLDLYSNYIEMATVPNLGGLSSRNALTRLAAARLELNLVVGDGAPAREKSGLVYEQSPRAGLQVEAGSKAQVTIYSDFVEEAVVPKVVGLKNAAAQSQLRGAGLKSVIRTGKKPANREQADTVQTQKPAAGTRISPGATVEVVVYSGYEPPVTLPDLRTLSWNDARNRLSSLGLTVSRREAGPATNRNQADTIRDQQPAAGTKVERGAAVNVSVYGTYTPTRDEVIADYDCRSVINSHAAWDAAANAPRCYCNPGYVLDASSHACVAPRPPTRDELVRNYNCRGVPNSHAAWDNQANAPRCYCNQGFVLDTRNNRCVPAQQPRPADNTGDCEYKITMITLFMNNYRANPSNKSQKQMAEEIAGQARQLGCNQTRIGQALGSGGRGGTRTPTPAPSNPCPPGMIPGTRLGSLGQEEACVPAGL